MMEFIRTVDDYLAKVQVRALRLRRDFLEVSLKKVNNRLHYNEIN